VKFRVVLDGVVDIVLDIVFAEVVLGAIVAALEGLVVAALVVLCKGLVFPPTFDAAIVEKNLVILLVLDLRLGVLGSLASGRR
jgi:hypothetical protein